MSPKSMHRDEGPSTLSPDPSVTAQVRGELQPEPDPPGVETSLSIPTLAAGDTLVVETRNSSYRFVVLDPLEHKILIRGGRFFARATEAVLLGSATDRKVRVGRLSLGRGFAVAVGHRCFVTSPIEAIQLEAQTQAVAAPSLTTTTAAALG